MNEAELDQLGDLSLGDGVEVPVQNKEEEKKVSTLKDHDVTNEENEEVLFFRRESTTKFLIPDAFILWTNFGDLKWSMVLYTDEALSYMNFVGFFRIGGSGNSLNVDETVPSTPDLIFLGSLFILVEFHMHCYESSKLW